MLTVDGTYNINGKDVSITFNQAHDGSFGAITSGLEEVRNTGVNEKKLDNLFHRRKHRRYIKYKRLFLHHL